MKCGGTISSWTHKMLCNLIWDKPLCIIKWQLRCCGNTTCNQPLKCEQDSYTPKTCYHIAMDGNPTFDCQNSYFIHKTWKETWKKKSFLSGNSHNMMQVFNNFPTSTTTPMFGWIIKHFQEGKQRLYLFIFHHGPTLRK